MSLRIFHIFFIVASILLGIGLGVWCLQEFRTTAQFTALALGAGSFVIAGFLIFYLRAFIKKTKQI